jgi:hypothetical protein
MSGLRLGYTGTRDTLTHWQVSMVEHMLRYHHALGYTKFHHGDCVGADEFAARQAYGLGYWVVAHPPTNEHLRAFAPAHEVRPALPYLERNQCIVMESHAALAVPDSEIPQPRSGTWSTINKLAVAGVPYWVIHPQGCWASTPTRIRPREQVLGDV